MIKKGVYKNVLSDYPEVMTIKDVCKALGNIDRKTCYKLITTNKLKGMKCGRSYIVVNKS